MYINFLNPRSSIPFPVPHFLSAPHPKSRRRGRRTAAQGRDRAPDGPSVRPRGPDRPTPPESSSVSLRHSAPDAARQLRFPRRRTPPARHTAPPPSPPAAASPPPSSASLAAGRRPPCRPPPSSSSLGSQLAPSPLESSGIFRGRGTRRVPDPRTGTGTGKNPPRERGRGWGWAIFPLSGSRTSARSPAGIAPLPSILEPLMRTNLV